MGVHFAILLFCNDLHFVDLAHLGGQHQPLVLRLDSFLDVLSGILLEQVYSGYDSHGLQEVPLGNSLVSSNSLSFLTYNRNYLRELSQGTEIDVSRQVTLARDLPKIWTRNILVVLNGTNAI